MPGKGPSEWEAETNLWDLPTWNRRVATCDSVFQMSNQKPRLCFVMTQKYQHSGGSFPKHRNPLGGSHISHRTSSFLCSHVCTKPQLHLLTDAWVFLTECKRNIFSIFLYPRAHYYPPSREYNKIKFCFPKNIIILSCLHLLLFLRSTTFGWHKGKKIWALFLLVSSGFIIFYQGIIKETAVTRIKVKFLKARKI